MTLRAIEIRTDTIDYIEAYAKERGFNLNYLRDSIDYPFSPVEDYAYVVTDGSVETRNLTFTEFTRSWFERTYKFKTTGPITEFTEIEKN